MDLRAKLEDTFCFGIFSKTTDSNLISAAGISGLDFIILDMEHGFASYETMQNHVKAAILTNVTPIIRVSSNNAEAVGKALDIGAKGVQIPNIANAEDAQKAVNYAKFYPFGSRGVCRFVSAANFGELNKHQYFKNSNRNLLILQVEGKEGMENLEEILEVDGYDMIFIGPYDLSQSIGKPGEIHSNEVKGLINRIAEIVKSKNKFLGTFTDTKEDLEYFKKQGFDYIAYSVDINIFIEKLKETTQAIKKI